MLNIHGNLNIAQRKGDRPPFYDDLSLFYTRREGLNLIESKEGLDAKILPSIAFINGTSYLSKSLVSFAASDSSGYVEAYVYVDQATLIDVFSSCDPARTTRYFAFFINAAGNAYITAREPGVGTPFSNTYLTDDAISVGWHKIKWASNGSSYTIYVDDIAVGGSGSNNGEWLGDVSASFRNNISIGALITSSPRISTNGNIAWVKYNNGTDVVNQWILTGYGINEYDNIGTTHVPWVNAPSNKYGIEGSQELLDNGFSEWRKAGALNEYVPYKNGSPQTQFDELLGYVKNSDNEGSTNKYNFAPSLVDFDYTDTTNILLSQFDKSNATIHITTGSMNYYDAAMPYGWRQDELNHPRIYSTTYKNNTYRGMLYVKGLVSGNNVINSDQILVYSSDYEGLNQYTIAKYCGLDGIVIKSGGVPVYDSDGYLTYLYNEPVSSSLAIGLVGDSIMVGIVPFWNYTAFTKINIANIGDEISLQEAAWNALTTIQQQSFDYVLIQLGLNDLGNSVSGFTSDYQSLVTQIETDTKAGCKIVAGNMTPVDGFFENPTTLAIWQGDNEAINGAGVYAISDIDIALVENNTDLNDGSDALKSEYDSGDHLHPNETGYKVLFNNFLKEIK